MALKSEIGIYRTSPQTLEKDIKRVFSSKQTGRFELKEQTYIKINGNFDFIYPGSNTSKWFLDGLLKVLIDRGFQNVKVVEGDLPNFTAEQMIKRTGFEEILERYGVSFVPYEGFPRDDNGIPRMLKNAQIINLPVFHTHGYAVISCATKNLFGFLPKDRRRYHKNLSEKLLELYESLEVFTIVDGTVGLEGESTRRGSPRKIDLILTGWDTLAIDSMVTRIMGYKSIDIPLLSMAKKKELLDEETIDIQGDFDEDHLPEVNFKLKLSPHRRLINAVDCTSVGDFGPIVWILSKLRRIYHYFNYFKKRRSLFNGPWMEYETEWKKRIEE